MIPSVILGWASGVASSALILFLRAYLTEHRDRQVYRRELKKDTHTRRIESDRQIYQRRITILIRSYLATYVRSGKWWNTRNARSRNKDISCPCQPPGRARKSCC